jgi:radical SAM-linked protein
MTDEHAPRQRLRLSFAKGEAIKYISHLDLARTWERVFRRAELPLAYSQGFNPRPRFQIAAALPVGVTGQSELLDIWLTDCLPAEEALARLRPVLPAGLDVSAAQEVELQVPSLQSQMRSARNRQRQSASVSRLCSTRRRSSASAITRASYRPTICGPSFRACL